MMGLNKFGATITILTAVTLTALAVEILYVLFKRRRRLRPRVRAEPLEPSLPISSSTSPIEREHESELDEELENHIAKYRSYYGPSRVLFTIKEEEREGVESENGSECSSVVTVKKALAVRNTRLNENVVVVVDGDGDDEVVVTVEELMNETTPYSTPCATSPYYTPQSSPTRGNG